MFGFWIAASSMLLAAGSFFLPLLLGRGQHSAIDRRCLNLAIYRQRRAELTEEAGGGNLQALEDELDRELLDELSEVSESASANSSQGRAVLFTGLLLVPLLGFALYLYVGRPDLTDYRGQASAGEDRQMTTAELQQNIAGLIEKLKNQPDDMESWALLARSYQFAEQYEQALATWEKTLSLAPDNADVMAAYAQALAEAHEGSLSGKPEQLIASALEKDRNHPEGLWLAGLLAAQQNKPAVAIDYWRRLKARLPEGSKPAQQVERFISQLSAQTGWSESSPADNVREKAAIGAKNIRVSVRLAEGWAEQMYPDDTLFIFARAASGPPMPLAVVRKLAKDLPLEITLDDTQFMRPEMKLSAFPEIIVGARISHSGQATPSSGDLQGMSAALKPVTGGRYQVVIDRKVQ
ncbi:c-type cytochrome biogenesis protein CcmI [Candidatus Methylospira mobilis]|uniref:c-type cytochrome biogenesis protein CcmI n=1 Tax=Candidatus Methylospira mobilis TaxID=1808979 RepID=UPI0028E80E9F|nr:c-type cytochrome biogenesis protein CcmI [Candidatus Methylospira mobilis]WNV04720.1 c-type cytochrome biogenesis protein CcmI [Candidatus Methylospira mobilis]